MLKHFLVLLNNAVHAFQGGVGRVREHTPQRLSIPDAV